MRRNLQEHSEKSIESSHSGIDPSEIEKDKIKGIAIFVSMIYYHVCKYISNFPV